MANRQVLYSATTPINGYMGGKVADGVHTPGNFPYFLSAPAARGKYPTWWGAAGSLLHVSAWIIALVVDSMIGAQIDQGQSPGAWDYWSWGIGTFGAAFVGVVIIAIVHFIAVMITRKNPASGWSNWVVAEGAAPPFLMTLFIGGVQISLILTILQMIASSGTPGTDFFNYKAEDDTLEKQKDYRATQRHLMVGAMAAKAYVLQFLQNNQEWAGPADALQLKNDANKSRM